MLSEDISSSPSGRHIGHYKAALGDSDLCTMYATLLSIPFKHGFTLHRWTSAAQVMLEKTKDCAQVDKLWVTHWIRSILSTGKAHFLDTSMDSSVQGETSEIDCALEDLSDGFKMLSEDISSSPSGRHIGHYKAVLGDLDICTMYATVLSIPFKHGFTLHRWTSAVQVMLEKTKGCARVWIPHGCFVVSNMSTTW